MIKRKNNIFKKPDGLKLLVGIFLFLIAIILNSNYFEENNLLNLIGIVTGIISFIIVFIYIKEEKNYNYMVKMTELYKEKKPQKYEEMKKKNKELERFENEK